MDDVDDVLCCPDCHKDVQWRGESLTCANCATEWAQPSGRPYIDLASAGSAEVEPATVAKKLMESSAFVKIYESVSRPLFVRLFAGPGADVPEPAAELEIYRQWIAEHGPGDLGDILDLSCGTGWFTGQLARLGIAQRVYGLDLSAAMVQRAVEETRDSGVAAFVRGDVYALPFTDGQFGAVVNPGSLHLYYRPAEAYAEVARVLRPGGLYMASTFATDDRAVGKLTTKLTGVRRTDLARLEEDLAAAGFGDFTLNTYGSIFIFMCRKTGDPR